MFANNFSFQHVILGSLVKTMLFMENLFGKLVFRYHFWGSWYRHKVEASPRQTRGLPYLRQDVSIRMVLSSVRA